MTLWHRLKAGHRVRRGRVALWYHPQYAPASLRGTHRVPHLQLDRGEQILGALRHAGLLGRRWVRSAPLASLDELRAVHLDPYLERMTQAGPLAAVFGLDEGAIDVEEVLRAQRRAVGGTVAAAVWAVGGPGVEASGGAGAGSLAAAPTAGARIAVNLGGGMHHAHRDKGGGFCVFHDVAVAIAVLRRRGFSRPIAIVDLDFHQDDGTTDIFSGDDSVVTYSIHGSAWDLEPGRRPPPAGRGVILPPGTDDDAYLEALQRTLPPLLAAARPGLVFYLAGTDVLAGDPLGQFGLTPHGVLRRDRFVLAQAAAGGWPLVITLAGGYTPESPRATARLVAAVLADAVPPEVAAVDLRERYDRIARTLDVFDLQRDEGAPVATSEAAAPASGPWVLDDADVLDELGGRRRTRRVLGFYSAHGVELALERYGLLAALRARGFGALRVAVDPERSDHQRVTVWGQRGGREHQLLDLVVRRASLASPTGLAGDEGLELLSIEWLLLQDPSAAFAPGRPSLPGQKHPGLGLVREVMELLRQASLRLGLDGILLRPAHYHVAAISYPNVCFLDPEVQGRLDAVRELLAGRSIPEASHLVERGAVLLDGEPWRWCTEPAVAATSDRLRAYLASGQYEQLRRRAYEATRAAARLDPQVEGHR